VHKSAPKIAKVGLVGRQSYRNNKQAYFLAYPVQYDTGTVPDVEKIAT